MRLMDRLTEMRMCTPTGEHFLAAYGQAVRGAVGACFLARGLKAGGQL